MPFWPAAADFEEQVIATPAIADGRLYVRTAANLYCLAEEKAR